MILSLNILFLLLLIRYVIFELSSVIKNSDSQIIIFFFIFFTIAHFGISIGYVYLLERLTVIRDPIVFYDTALVVGKWSDSFGLGSQFVSFLIYPFVHLGIKIEMLFLLFSTISFKGFLIYFEMIEIQKIRNKNVFLLFFYFLPTLHFWTGSLAKEALLFFFMVILLRNVKFKSFDISFVFSLLIIFLIRPHVFFVLISTLILLFFMARKIDNMLKIRMLIFIFLSIFILLPLALKFFLKIDILNFESLENWIFKFLDYTKAMGGSSISLIDTNVISRMLYLVFMPLPFLYDFKNILQILVSIENVFFLFGILYSLYYIIKERIKWEALKDDFRFAIISSFLLIILFGSYLYNLGLGNRMRIMFLPYIFYFIIGVFTSKQILYDEKK